MLYNSLHVLKPTEVYELNCAVCDLYLSKAVTKHEHIHPNTLLPESQVRLTASPGSTYSQDAPRGTASRVPSQRTAWWAGGRSWSCSGQLGHQRFHPAEQRAASSALGFLEHIPEKDIFQLLLRITALRPQAKRFTFESFQKEPIKKRPAKFRNRGKTCCQKVWRILVTLETRWRRYGNCIF